MHREATEVRVSNWVRGYSERRAASGRHVLDEDAALTPIFHSLNRSGWRDRQRPEPVRGRDEVDEFRRDPLTAPIPVQAFSAAATPSTALPRTPPRRRRAAPPTPADPGAHALVEPREGGRHHFRLEAAGHR